MCVWVHARCHAGSLEPDVTLTRQKLRRALLYMGLFQGGGGVVKRNENVETLVVRSCVDPKASANNPD